LDPWKDVLYEPDRAAPVGAPRHIPVETDRCLSWLGPSGIPDAMLRRQYLYRRAFASGADQALTDQSLRSGIVADDARRSGYPQTLHADCHGLQEPEIQ